MEILEDAQTETIVKEKNLLSIIKEEDLVAVQEKLEDIAEFERPSFIAKRYKDGDTYRVSGYASCPIHIVELLESMEEVETIETENTNQWLLENNYLTEEE